MNYKIYEVREYENGIKEWYINGKLHRENGPAVEYSSGAKEWYINGKLHRENGPAVECSNGDKRWYKDDKRHRENGPAVEWSDGSKFYYLNDKKYTKEEYYSKINTKTITIKGKEVSEDTVEIALKEYFK